MNFRYRPQELKGYIIINDKSVDTIHLEIGKPRIRITLDKRKWTVLSHLADSGSIISVTIKPKSAVNGS